MGLFSKRRTRGFDPDLWSDAKERGKDSGEQPWFADLAETAGEDLDAVATNGSANFEDADDDWLTDDPGEKIRKR